MRAIDLLDQHGVTIAGLQELESPQRDVFARRFAGRWSAWFPGDDSRNAIIWRVDAWQLLDTRSFAIPYVHGIDQMPVVLLQNRTTAAQLYVVNVQNPSNMYGSLAYQRTAALRIESRLADQLLGTATAVVVTGDFNDKNAPGCAFTPRLSSAFGSTRGRCGARPGGSVDHIFGGGVTFGRTVSDRAPSRSRVSDHALLMTTVSVAGS